MWDLLFVTKNQHTNLVFRSYSFSLLLIPKKKGILTLRKLNKRPFDFLFQDMEKKKRNGRYLNNKQTRKKS